MWTRRHVKEKLRLQATYDTYVVGRTFIYMTHDLSDGLQRFTGCIAFYSRYHECSGLRRSRRCHIGVGCISAAEAIR